MTNQLSAVQKIIVGSMTKKLKSAGIKKVIIDFSKNDLDIQEYPDTHELIPTARRKMLEEIYYKTINKKNV